MNKIIIIFLIGMIISFTVSFVVSSYAYADEKNPIVQILEIFVDTQFDLVNQNNVIIEQNYVIIELLKGDRDIFVAGINDRYKLMKYVNYGNCEFYDKLLEITETGTCPITGMTKDQFNSMLNAKPEN